MLRAVRFVVRISAWVLGAATIVVVLGATLGRLGAIAGIAAASTASVALWLWLPRAAHAAFEAGRYAPAARRYRVLGWIAPSPQRERASLLSRAGCHVAAGELDAAAHLLDVLG